MPMMLALLLSNSVQSLDRTATRAVGSEAERVGKESQLMLIILAPCFLNESIQLLVGTATRALVEKPKAKLKQGCVEDWLCSIVWCQNRYTTALQDVV